MSPHLGKKSAANDTSEVVIACKASYGWLFSSGADTEGTWKMILHCSEAKFCCLFFFFKRYLLSYRFGNMVGWFLCMYLLFEGKTPKCLAKVFSMGSL